MRISDIIALRGSCQRAQVGCVIVKDGRIVSTGYNGPLSYGDCAHKCKINQPCKEAVHAEANAIYFAANHGIPLDGCTLYCNFSPCIKCTEAIIQSGIKRVVYRIPYRDSEPLSRLISAGVVLYEHK